MTTQTTKNSRRRLTIAVDGFSSCGKSTFAKALAARFGYIFVDTGAMYRAVTLFALENGAIRSGIVDDEALIALLPKIDIAFRFNPKRGASDIYVNGDLVEGKIRTIEVSNCVSSVSSIGEVRESPSMSSTFRSTPIISAAMASVSKSERSTRSRGSHAIGTSDSSAATMSEPQTIASGAM
jgi:cytidylate kinase